MVVITKLIMLGIAIVCAIASAFIILDFVTDKVMSKLLKKRNRVHFYVARDKCDDLWIYMGKPIRGECPFLKYEDTDGYGICDISGIGSNCSLVCAFDKKDKLTYRQAVKVLHHAQKWRRGEKIGMPPPALLGLAIDKAIRVLRQKIKEENV